MELLCRVRLDKDTATGQAIWSVYSNSADIIALLTSRGTAPVRGKIAWAVNTLTRLYNVIEHSNVDDLRVLCTDSRMLAELEDALQETGPNEHRVCCITSFFLVAMFMSNYSKCITVTKRTDLQRHIPDASLCSRSPTQICARFLQY